jgi:hypothetical protein
MKGLVIAIVAASIWSFSVAQAQNESTLRFDATQLITNEDHTSFVYSGAYEIAAGLDLTLPAVHYLVVLHDGEESSLITVSVDERTDLWTVSPECVQEDVPTSDEGIRLSADALTDHRPGQTAVTVKGTLTVDGIRYAEVIVFPVTIDSEYTVRFNTAISIYVADRKLASGDLIPRRDIAPEARSTRSFVRSGAASGATDYIIVTSATLALEFQRLAVYKNQTGYVTSVLLIDDILAGQSGRDNAEKLREYLKSFYEQGGRYVLLGGDETVIPIRYAYPNNTSSLPALDALQICDLYFADVTGEWDVDNDGVWGEKYEDDPDIIPELRVGRVPVNTVAEVRHYVDKLIAYETNPGRGDAAYLERAFFFSADQMRDYSEGGQHGRIARAYPDYFEIDTTHGLEMATGADPSPTNPIGPELDTILQRGYGIINILTHGGSTDFCIRSAGINQSPRSYYGSPQIAVLKNDGRTSFYYSLACSSGGFDRDQPPFNEPDANLVQRLLGHPGAGAVGFVAYSRWGWIGSSHLLQRAFFDSLFAHPGRPAIDAMNEAKARYYYYTDLVYGQNFYGDPTLVVYTEAPTTLNIALSFRDDGLLAAVTADGSPAGNCLLVLAIDGECIGQYVTSADGSATISQELDPGLEYTISAVQSGATIDQQTFIGSLVTSVDDENDGLPHSFALEQNYPNPFNPSTEIAFELPKASQVLLTVYNILGQVVTVLVDEQLPAGHHSVSWHADTFASGLYLYRLDTGEFSQSRKMLLVR